MNDRPIRANILTTHRLPTGETIEAAQCQWASGQIVGMGWLAVRVDGSEWIDVDFRSQLKLVLTVQACEALEEIQDHVINGSQWPPFTRADRRRKP